MALFGLRAHQDVGDRMTLVAACVDYIEMSARLDDNHVALKTRQLETSHPL
ncbi:MAG: hypothetical protein ABW110_21115 [Steroidobacteraceae bacterium]